MSDNPQELVEAQLLAYVEGDLDDAGRAEIERHLEANPKHRQLLADLQIGRKWVRGLRKEAAPTELFDGVQSQLERQLLLDVAQFPKIAATSSIRSASSINEEPDDSTLRIHRRARIRFAAAAAVVFGGIGVVIYSSLPPRQNGIAEGPGKSSTTSPGELAVAAPSQSSPGVASANGPSLGGRSLDTGETAKSGLPGDNPLNLAPIGNLPADGQRLRSTSPEPTAGKGGPEKQAAPPGPPTLRPDELAEVAESARSAPAVRQVIDELRREKERQLRQPMPMAKAAAPSPSGAKDEGSNGGMQLAQKSQALSDPDHVGADAAPLDRRRAAEHRAEPMVLVIASADPVLSRQELADVLKQQDLSFRQVELSDNPPLRKSTGGMDRQDQPTEKLADARPAPASAAPAPVMPAPMIAPPATPAPSPTPIPAMPGPAAPGTGTPTPAGVPESVAPPAPPAPAVPAPTVPAADPQAPASPRPIAPAAPAKPFFDASTKPSRSVPETRPTGPSSTRPTNRNAIVVARVSRSRADKLISQLSRPTATQYLLTSVEGSTKKEMNRADDAAGQPFGSATQPAIAGASADKAPGMKPGAGRRAADATKLDELPQKPGNMPAAPMSKPTAEPATQAARADDKIHPGDTIQLARSLRPGGPPVVLRLTVADDGTIFVLSVSNVAIGGLTAEAASDLLTQKLREKRPEAPHADIRRLTDVPPVTPIARGVGGGSGGGPNFKRDGLRSENGVAGEPTARSQKGGEQADAAQRPVTSPAKAPTGGALQQAQNERESIDAKGDELIDLVIIVESPTGK